MLKRCNFALVTTFVLCTTVWAIPQGNAQPRKAPASKTAQSAVPMRKVEIAPVSDATKFAVRRSAQKIDQLVEANYKKHKVTPNELTNDEEFVRRAYLDITGTIPDYRQARSFIRSKRTGKREQLINDLLADPGYASHTYNFWADILRVSERLANNVPGAPFQEWVKISIEKNTPYDKFVYEMLTAEGRVWDNGAAGYALRDSGMPLDAVNNTVRIFLGTQIGCAQCHNHPFDRWTQKEFYEMAAFTYGVETRRSAADKRFGGTNVVARLRDELKMIDEDFDGGGKYNRFLLSNLMEVNEVNRTLVLPHDYAYKDAKPRQAISPRAIFDPQPVAKPGESARITMARWLTSKENPRFTVTIVNRLWKQAFGVGLIEPVDDMRDNTVAENPELMKFLVSEMHRVNFDMKEFMRIIYNTQTYQRQATFAELEPGDEYHFPGPILRRMTPEQIWDSFITLAVVKPENFQTEPSHLQADLLKVDLASITAEELFERDKQLRQVTSYRVRTDREKAYRHQGLLLVRASELPQPLPPSHFLRQFGQSDRETIQGNFDSGSVPQVLQMFNGPLTHLLLHPKSTTYANVVMQKTLDERVDAIFYGVLSRLPTDEERQVANEEIQSNGNVGYGNVIWALVNTREFLFVQ